MTRPYRTPEKIERAKNLRRKVNMYRSMLEQTYVGVFGSPRPFKRPTSNAMVFNLYNTATIHEDAD